MAEATEPVAPSGRLMLALLPPASPAQEEAAICKIGRFRFSGSSARVDMSFPTDGDPPPPAFWLSYPSDGLPGLEESPPAPAIATREAFVNKSFEISTQSELHIH